MAFVGAVLGDLFSDAQIVIHLEIVAPGRLSPSQSEGIGIAPAASDRVANGVAVRGDDGLLAHLSPLLSLHGRDPFARKG